MSQIHKQIDYSNNDIINYIDQKIGGEQNNHAQSFVYKNKNVS
jgi:hypothetical protein